ncbi:hypothetical protein DFJ73DRAFT_821325, partial [Zopfochytrium polystomum]
MLKTLSHRQHAPPPTRIGRTSPPFVRLPLAVTLALAFVLVPTAFLELNAGANHGHTVLASPDGEGETGFATNVLIDSSHEFVDTHAQAIREFDELDEFGSKYDRSDEDDEQDDHDEPDSNVTDGAPATQLNFLELAVRWVQTNSKLILLVSGTILVANFTFFAFAMGYLLKEEHVVVRFIKFKNQPAAVVWRTLIDVEAYPAWRKELGSVSVVSRPTKKSLVGVKHTERVGLTAKTYTVTEEEPLRLLVRKTHPDYKPVEYAQPMVLKGAPIAANINEPFKKAAAKTKKETEPSGDGVGSASPAPASGSKAPNVLDLPLAPLFYPPTVPSATETWTFELDDLPGGGSALYVTYQGTIRSRFVRFARSLTGNDRKVELFIGQLASFLGESTGSRKPHLGKISFD